MWYSASPPQSDLGPSGKRPFGAPSLEFASQMPRQELAQTTSGLRSQRTPGTATLGAGKPKSGVGIHKDSAGSSRTVQNSGDNLG